MEKSDIRKQVEEFMVAAGQEVKDTPGIPDEETIKLRAKLTMEEAFEFLEALFGESDDLTMLESSVVSLIESSKPNVNIVEVADSLGDMDVVNEGARLAFGINGKPVADEIHRSNMAKLGIGSYKREDGKLMKPPGWTPPDIAGVLEKQK